MNTVPYEVIAAPFTLYAAPVGTAFPNVEDEPAVEWVKIGTSGDLNYDDAAGVVIEHSQTVNPWRALGDSGSRKVFRTEEDLKIKIKLVDVTLEQYARALNGNSVTDTAAIGNDGGFRSLGLSRGFTVATHALLVRGDVSPYGETYKMQYEIPIAAQSGSPTVTYKKGEPAGLDLEWMALVDPSQPAAERFGRLIAQDAEPVS